MDAQETIEKNGMIGKIGFDPEPESPRDWEGNYGTIYHTHPNYDLGERVTDHDDALYKLSQEDGVTIECSHCGNELEYTGYGWENAVVDSEEPDECEKAPAQQHPFIKTITYHPHNPTVKGAVYYPVYAYEHGGITLSMGGFSCPWDSGQVGIIATTDKRLAEGGFVPSDNLGVKELLEGEIKDYATYLEGMIYAYEIETVDGDHVSSCGGYYTEEEAKSEMLAEMED